MTEGRCECVITAAPAGLCPCLPSFPRTICLRVLDPRRTSDLPRPAWCPRTHAYDWPSDFDLGLTTSLTCGLQYKKATSSTCSHSHHQNRRSPIPRHPLSNLDQHIPPAELEQHGI